MPRILVLSLFALTLILSACSANNDDTTEEAEDEVVATEEESEDELSEIEKENEELRKEIAERENDELKDELEENNESPDESESTDEDTSSEDSNDSSEDNNEETKNNGTAQMTIDECVLALFEDDCHENFENDEVEDVYLEYAYNDEVPYEGGGSQSLEYVVASVQYYDEHGEFPGLEDIEVEHELTTEDYENFEKLIKEYLSRLTDYFNRENPDNDVFFYLKEGSPAYNKVMANVESGNFVDHTTHDIFVSYIYPQDDGTVTIDVIRTFEHATSNGIQDSNVTYTMDMETYEIIDFN